MDKTFSTTDFLIISSIIFVSVIDNSINKISKGLIPVWALEKNGLSIIVF